MRPDPGADAPTKTHAVCIVTPDIVGPIRNGGIGTAATALSRLLADHGRKVTILYTGGAHTETASIEHWIEVYRRQGIDFVPLPASQVTIHPAGPSNLSYCVYLWLKDQSPSFSVIYFCEWKGAGFFSIEARRTGVALLDSPMVVVAHSPTLWHLSNNQELLPDAEPLLVDHLERRSVQHADLTVSPSAYLFGWMDLEGWARPRRGRVLQNVTSGVEPAIKPFQTREPVPVTELVFFGRLEARKGLRVFCAALSRLQDLAAKPLKVTFLGKDSQGADGFDPRAFIAAQAAQWRFEWSIVADKQSEEALAYLAGPGRLAVSPSLVENSPYTVLECLARGLPFIASDVGGTPELLLEADRPTHLVAPTTLALTERLDRALREGVAPGALQAPQAQTHAAWLALDAELAAMPRADVQMTDQPHVTVCLTHYNRPDLLRCALKGLAAQTYRKFDVVIVDDGSDDPAALAALEALDGAIGEIPVQLVRQSNAFLGAARNRAAACAHGEYLLFHDDDNVAMPEQLETFVRAARLTGADILTCVAARFPGQTPPSVGSQAARDLVAPVGGALAYGALSNEFGDANSLFKREAFQRLGGFTEDYGVGHEDWEIFARASLAGLDVSVVPAPLFWYKVSPTGMLRSETARGAALTRSLRPYLEGQPAHVRQLILLAQGLNERSRRRWVALDLLEGMGADARRRRDGLSGILADSGVKEADPDRRVLAAAAAVQNSAFLRLTRPLRSLHNVGRGRAPEPASLGITEPEAAIEYLLAVSRSRSWRLTAPLRWLRRRLEPRRGQSG